MINLTDIPVFVVDEYKTHPTRIGTTTIGDTDALAAHVASNWQGDGEHNYAATWEFFADGILITVRES